ncbi:MAG: alpha/beta hydrolase [Myxococcaceae bacterium]|jgi:pimeloyl-ACP methyl ester carboxylesterase|nr:alpha/beta hydrolase [Myxococcaceae bacterium]
MPTIRVNDYSYEYAWWGQGEALAPVLLLHEAAGHAKGWGEFPQRLADATDRRVYAFSRLGWGESEPRPDPLGPGYLEHEALDVLPAMRGALGLERVVLLGHQEGASIALLHAGAAAQPVEAVIAMAPILFVDDGLRLEIRRMYQRGLPDSLLAAASDPERTFTDWATLWTGAKLATWQMDDFLRGVTCPALGLRGDQDAFTSAAHLERLATLVKQLEVVQLSGCRHLPFIDKPAAVVTAVSAFLRPLP